MRLVEAYQGEGLRGFSNGVHIPHCQGVYGASRSGGRDYNRIWEEEDQIAKVRGVGDRQDLLLPMEEYQKRGFEYGGVRIYRPLMAYRKQELETTLHRAGVPWVTDPTNTDPTLTVRNTVRHLMQQRLLPQAIDSGLDNQLSALKIAANNIRRRHQRRDEEAKALFQACDVAAFNARSGYLEVRLPFSTALSSPDVCRLPEDQKRKEIEFIGARLVRLLLNIVSPKDAISLQTLETATDAMFGVSQKDRYADFFPGVTASGEWAEPPLLKLTAGGVLGERVKMPSEELPLPGAQLSMLDPEYIWRFSRAPYAKNLPEPSCVVPAAALVTQVKTEEQPSSTGHSGLGYSTEESAKEGLSHGDLSREPEWRLWDKRYWIQVFNQTDKPLTICPFSADRALRLRRTMKANNDMESWWRLKRGLRYCGPPQARSTIPAIVDEEDNVLALPTIDFAPTVGQSGTQSLTWRVRYKSIDLPARVQDERVIALKEGMLDGVESALWKVAEREDRQISK
ncbi:MAG: hypothetical protein LQ346_001905 [Caloplaca aetnensis]|nr:MAG: hypothetical protein LQ346_001905 [Caloplaca aetnensis]